MEMEEEVVEAVEAEEAIQEIKMTEDLGQS